MNATLCSRFSTTLLSLTLASSLHAGSVLRWFYDGLSTSSSLDATRRGLASLTNSPKFPNRADFREQLDDFSTLPNVPLRAGLQGKDNSGTDYGSWIRGYLEAPVSGSYIFGIASDDNSALFLSTDHTEANRRLIAYEAESGGSLFGGVRLNERNSAPVTLERGRRYYFEVLHKQGGGGALVQVGWIRPDGVQEIIPALHLAQHPIDPFAGRFDTNQPPIFNGAGLNQGSLPPTLTVDEGSELLLPLDVIAAQPASTRWTRDGATIPGEILGFLRVPRVPGSWNGSRIGAVVSNGFGQAESAPTLLTVRRDATPPAVREADTGGNPNALRITFSEAINEAGATNPANFEVRGPGGALPARSAVLSADQRTVTLEGAFGFVAGPGYSVTVRGIVDLASVPNPLSPSPATVPFTFSAPSGTTFSFNDGAPAGVRLSGNARIVPTGGSDGGGFLELTDANRNRNGAALWTDRRLIDQVRLRFKARFGDGSSTDGIEPPGDGLSVTLGSDLPLGTIDRPEEGFIPPFIQGRRFIVSFDPHPDGSADLVGISVLWDNQVLTNVVTGVSGIPPIARDDGRWLDVDIDLRRNGRLTLRVDGVSVLDQLETPFEAIANGQILFAARTRSWWQTHWIDELNVNYSEGDFGNAGLSSTSTLGGIFPEGREVRLSAEPSGAGPFTYQWFRDGTTVAGATNRTLVLPGVPDSAGLYSIAVGNGFSQFRSEPSRVTIQPDRNPPALLGVRGIAGGVRRVLLRFDEPLDPVSATDPAVYRSPFFRVLSASLGMDGRSVTLQTTALRAGVTYPLRISGLRDLSAAANPLEFSGTFAATVSHRDEVLGDDPVRYYRFEEPRGTEAATEVSSSDLVNTNGTFINEPLLGVPGLLPSDPSGRATRFVAARTNYVAVPNGGDINDFRGPWSQRSIAFWFRAQSMPAPGTTGLAATAGLYEEGGNLRSIHLHLWRNPANQDPAEADLVFHAFNDTSDGPGAPFGLRERPAVRVTTKVRTNVLYHVVGVLDGRTDSTDGELRLYLNGELAGRSTNGIGQIYNHNGDIRIGSGNARIFLNLNGTLGAFDGVIDELSIHNSVIGAQRVLDHYRAGIGEGVSATNPPVRWVGLETRGDPGQIRVTFDPPVDPATATNLANYRLSEPGGGSIPVTSAELLEDLVTVRLRGRFDLGTGRTYRLEIRNVADILAADNRIAPTARDFTFQSLGPVRIAAGGQPEARNAEENSRVEFSVRAEGEPPFRYQWLRDGVALAGATNATLALEASLAAAGGYGVTISNEFSGVQSSSARLAVSPDTTPPGLAEVTALAGSLNEIRLRFTEPLDPNPAARVSNYSADGLSILSATLSADGREVRLRTSPQVHGRSQRVNFTGLLDRAARPNEANGSRRVVSQIRYRDEVLSEGAVRYWTFDETAGSALGTLVSRLDQVAQNVVGTLTNNPTLGVPGLVPNLPLGTAIRFGDSPGTLALVPNGRDLNAILGPWPKRSHVFSFRASRLPRIRTSTRTDTNGLPVTTTTAEAPALFGHGRVAFYLYGTQDTDSPTEALLVFHAHNNASEGPGSPWGATTGNPATAKFVATPVQAGRTYHVVGVLDGDPNGFTGQIRLHVDGKQVGFAGGIGQLYRHPNNQPTFGQAGFLRHDGINVAIVPPITPPTVDGEFFQGVLDEFAILNRALGAERILQLHDFSLTPPAPELTSPGIRGLRTEGGNLIITWEGPGDLQRADSLTGPYRTIPAARNPHSEPVDQPGRFFRIQP